MYYKIPITNYGYNNFFFMIPWNWLQISLLFCKSKHLCLGMLHGTFMKKLKAVLTLLEIKDFSMWGEVLTGNISHWKDCMSWDYIRYNKWHCSRRG